MRPSSSQGMGIVSSIGNDTQEVTTSLHEGRFRYRFRNRNTLNLNFRLPWSMARRRSMSRRLSIAAPCASTVAARPWNHVAMDQAIAQSGLEQNEISNEPHRYHHGLRPGPRHAPSVEAARHHPGQGPQTHRSLRRAQGDVPRPLPRRSPPGSRSKGRELFDLLGLRHLEPLPSANAFEDHPRRDGRNIIFAGGCEDLDWTLSNLFDANGGDVEQVHTTRPRTASARL